jgi:hypothetical protein
MHSLHLLDALLEGSIESSLILSPQRTRNRVLPLNATRASAQCPPGGVSRVLSYYGMSCSLLCAVLPPRYLSTLRLLPESVTSAGVPSWHVLGQIPQNSGVHLCTGFQNPQHFATPS